MYTHYTHSRITDAFAGFFSLPFASSSINRMHVELTGVRYSFCTEKSFFGKQIIM